MVTMEDADHRRELVTESADLRSLQQRLWQRSERILREMPTVPKEKALLSRDGGVCPDDGAPLLFDPWSPDAYRCSRCDRPVTGDRHRRAWARYQHLWIAEQAAQLAAQAALGAPEQAAVRAADLLGAYANYGSYPNSDNVLGPARLFFSTYLESVWLTNYLAAAVLLREAGLLPDPASDTVGLVADDAAALIGEFSEGFSNRQAWHNAALAAVAVWFEDAELAERAIEGDTGLLALLARGIGGDGLWHEGENYHLFAMQGLLTGVRWARLCGMDLAADPAIARRLSEALRAPMITALPDATFPARRDSRFGVSLAQPMYLELWETGLGLLQGREGADTTGFGWWLGQRYAGAAPEARLLDSWLYEAGTPAPSVRSRASLSWHVLLEGLPALPDDGPWEAPSALLPTQGLAILRRGSRYASLEAGPWAGGHGHPDRLHLTLFADGVHWLPDPGTGSYVDRDLFWYRSTLAHNAPLLDGASQAGGDAHCEAFEAGGDWSWVQGSWGDLTRTVVLGPDYLLDVVQLASDHDRVLGLPWHVAGALTLRGAVSPSDLTLGEFAGNVRDVAHEVAGCWQVSAQADSRALQLALGGAGTLHVARGPGVPGGAPCDFLLRRASGRDAMLVTVLAWGDALPAVSVTGSAITVETGGVRHVHAPLSDGWEIQAGPARVRLGGRLIRTPSFEPLVTRVRREPARGTVLHIPAVPALDGTLDGFDAGMSLELDHEDQYRRTEEPYGGPEIFGAQVVANWDADALYLAIAVRDDEPFFRPAGAEPLLLDNEPDDINSSGVQVYLEGPDGERWAVLVVPEVGGTIRVRPVADSEAVTGDVRGAWQRTDDGYLVTLAVSPPFWHPLSLGREARFDLIVNQMRPGRTRRAGQLVWSGGGGWAYLQGDRQDPASFGVLDLV